MALSRQSPETCPWGDGLPASATTTHPGSERAFCPNLTQAQLMPWLHRFLRLLLLTTAFPLLRSSGESVTPPPPTSVFSVRGILNQDGAGLPTTWGREDGWEAPAWYRMNLPASGASPEIEQRLEQALEALPHLFLNLKPEDLYGEELGLYRHTQESGDSWERPVQLTFRTTSRGPGFEVHAGLRIQGGWNRRPKESPKHSFRVVFRSRYGMSSLKNALFPGQNGNLDQFILRAGNNHSWLHWDGKERRSADYLRDPWMRATYSVMGHPASRSRPVHLHLNGLYWGIYDLCERPDAGFAARTWGGRNIDYDSRNADKVLSGDTVAWDRMMSLVNAGITNEVSEAALRAELDIPAFIDFMLLNLYGANGDWDRASNWYAARRRNPAGLWQFLVWDGERTLEDPQDNRLKDDDDQSPTRIFQKLRQSPAFRHEFATRARKHLAPGAALSADAAAARYRSMADRLEPALFAEALRWGDYRNRIHRYKDGPYETYTVEGHWKPEVDRIVHRYFPARVEAFKAQLQEAGLYEP